MINFYNHKHKQKKNEKIYFLNSNHWNFQEKKTDIKFCCLKITLCNG